MSTLSYTQNYLFDWQKATEICRTMGLVSDMHPPAVGLRPAYHTLFGDLWTKVAGAETRTSDRDQAQQQNHKSMHDIEPFHQWRDLYIASEDPQSPFFRRKYSEFTFTHKIYNYYIHPQWDSFGSATLYLKVLFCDYEDGYAIIEMLGEWNDTLHNDIMVLKRDVLEPMMQSGIVRFVFICDNLLNFHSGDDDYYQELAEELRDERPAGWAVFVNTRQHVYEEMHDGRLDHYVQFGEQYNDVNWRILKPPMVIDAIEGMLDTRTRRVGWSEM